MTVLLLSDDEYDELKVPGMFVSRLRFDGAHGKRVNLIMVGNDQEELENWASSLIAAGKAILRKPSRRKSDG